uniref:SAF domain-containing protein n=1 Tax=Aeromonas finlandensis TaxID=1543375 RepID=UPI0012E039DA
MNQKLMFLISIIVIVVGVSGIVLNNVDPQAPTPMETMEKKPSPDKAIKLLVAKRDLTQGSILEADDYSVKVINAADNSEWSKYHSNRNFTEYLGSYITASVAQGEYILPEILLTSGHPEYMKRSLGQDIAYTLTIRPQDH